ncbi:AraC family transcriptional regulator [Clostridium rectalis]|uniref:AraC family transcriptional regulator n=1 Tax=Clostridium rectalis TaxID=2040295 RepID=UPI000F62D875|nr:AraC family transcriptional regulator [Clostridium rectalis]
MECFNEKLENKRGYLKSDFEIFHLKDQKDLEFAFHYHDFNKIIVFISGKVTYLIEGKSYKLRPWDILIINKNEIHKPIIDSKEVYERIIIWVNTEFILKHNSKECDLLKSFKIARKEKLNLLRLTPNLIEKLKYILLNLENAKVDNRFGSHILSNSLFLQFLVYLNRLFLGNNKANNENVDIEYDENIDKVLNYINVNICDDLSIEKIASILYINKYYLMHKFKKHTGYTIYNYIIQKRLIRAITLMKEGKNATEACMNSGFKDYSNFVRVFKKNFKMSPKNYREGFK